MVLRLLARRYSSPETNPEGEMNKGTVVLGKGVTTLIFFPSGLLSYVVREVKEGLAFSICSFWACGVDARRAISCARQEILSQSAGHVR